MDQQITPDATPAQGTLPSAAVADPPPPSAAPTSSPPSAVTVPPTVANDRPLNVSDALGYLDEVKNRFQDRPDVYNSFLDIMKDFKGQVITTPGVIERVSKLFSGHPELISGFNTFLPPGYRIECSTGENHLITVTTPTGTLTQNATGDLTEQFAPNAPPEPPGQDAEGDMRMAEPEPLPEVQLPPPTPHPPRSHVPTPQPQPQPPAVPVHIALPPPNPSIGAVAMSNFPPSLLLSPAQALNSNSTTASAASVLGGMHRVVSQPEPPHPTHPPAALHPSLPQAQTPASVPTPLATPGFPPAQNEFNHAIQYINRIKTRFADEPETYKQFLEILQTYQKEQRLLQDVYAQVTQLFRGAPDLIDEFKMFLPGANADPNATIGVPPPGMPPAPAAFGAPGGTVGVMGVLGQAGAPGTAVPDTEWTMEVQSVKGDKGVGYRRKVGGSDQNREGPPVKKRRKPEPRERDRDRDRENVPTKGAPRAKKSKHPHPHSHPHPRIPEPASPTFPQYVHPPSPHGPMHHPPVPAPQAAAPPPPPPQVPTAPAPPEVFFDRVKRSLDDRDAWDEFLKLLSLYANDVFEEDVLLRAAAPFLGGAGSDLEMQFRTMLGIERPGRRDEFGAVPATVGHAHGYGHPTGMGSMYLSGQKHRYGPSYRRLPDSETTLACSGRDELCRAVLNDDWVSHPTWASEESGFIAHKKNAYEEALHKSEEERHEYHVHLEAMAHTISLLEPIAYKISDMAAEERAIFRLRPDLGGRTASVHQRIIKKVYGREHAQEVLLGLQENPAVAVPVVLDRLKQVDAEWRKNKREWEKVWRDVDARNFYKSLDHQGVGFKANDKKAITGKALVAEIERIKETQDEKRAADEEKDATDARNDDPRVRAKRSRILPRYQLEYDMQDEAVLQDALKLTISFLERNDQRQSGSTVQQYNAVERRRIEAFLRHYVMHQFGLGPDFDAVFGPPVDQAEWEDLGLYVADGDEDSADEEDADTRRKRRSGKRSGGSGGGGAVSAGDLNKKLSKTKRAMERLHGRKNRGAQSNSNSSRASRESSRQASPAAPGSQPSSPPTVEHALPALDKAKGRAIDLDDDVWLRHVELVIPGQDSARPRAVNGTEHQPMEVVNEQQSTGHRQFGSFFCNNTFYTLIRLLHLLYSRLMECKSLAARLSADSPTSFLPNPVAMDLGLTDTAGPAGYFANLAAGTFPLDTRRRPTRFGATLTLHPSDQEKSASSSPAEYFYVHLLDLVEKVFDGELEQTTFEENMRFMFSTRAFVVYTLDKLCAAICKQVQAVVQDGRCHELMSMLQQQRTRDAEAGGSGSSVDVQSIIRYRRQAEDIVGIEENLFRVDWHGENKCLRIQLLDTDDLSFDPSPLSLRRGSNLSLQSESTTPEAVNSRMTTRWKQYVQSYVLRYPTEGRRIGVGRKIFLKKTLLEDDADELADTRWMTDAKPGQGLEVMVGPGTCKLYYASGCEETMWRMKLPPSQDSERIVENRKRKRRKRRRGSSEEEDAEEEEEPSVRDRLRERAEARARERKRWVVSFDQGILF